MGLFLNEYEIINSSISQQGGFARVYKVRHSTLGYIRAIRVLNQSIPDENDIIYKKFLEECKLLLRLGNGGHPNIVRIAQPRLLQNHALVEMEYIEGEDLNDYILTTCKKFVPINEIMNFTQNISSAMAYCHFDIFKFCINKDIDTCVQDDDDGKMLITPECERNLVDKYKVIHNDIHSKNIIRKYDGAYILLDFGLAIKSDSVVKSSARKGGVDEYKAPEKFDDDGIINEQTDIYSFGVLMYEMLTGSVPFPLMNTNSQSQVFELKNKHEKTPPPPIEPQRKLAFEQNNPNKIWKKDYPDWLEQMILKCLEKKPQDRYANAKVLHNFVVKQLDTKNSEKEELEKLHKKVKELQNNKIQIEGVIEDLENRILINTDAKKAKDLEDLQQCIELQIEEINKLKDKIYFYELENEPNKTPKNNKNIIFIIGVFAVVAFIAILIWQFPGNNSGSKSPNATTSAQEVNQVTDKEYELYGEKFTYTGQILNGKPHGWGKAIYNDGMYKGTFSEGYRSGKGKRTYSDGEYYEGDYNENELQGFGKYKYSDGSYYEGQFLLSKITGMGTVYDATGKISQQGRFIDSKFVQ